MHVVLNVYNLTELIIVQAILILFLVVLNVLKVLNLNLHQLQFILALMQLESINLSRFPNVFTELIWKSFQ